MGRRAQGVGGARGTLPELVVLLQQFVVAQGFVRPCALPALAGCAPDSWAPASAAPDSSGRHVFSGTTPIVENSQVGLLGRGQK